MLNIIPLLTSPSDRISEGGFLSVSPSNPVRQNGFTVTQFCYCLFHLPLPYVLPESEPFEQEVIIDIVFPGNTGNRGSWLQNQFNHLKFNSFENDLRGSADNVFAP